MSNSDSSFTEVLIKQARYLWYAAMEESIRLGRYSAKTINGIRETRNRVEEMMLNRLTSLNEMANNISDLENDIPYLEGYLLDRDLTIDLWNEEIVEEEESHRLAFPSCIRDIGYWNLELEDSYLMFRASKEAEKLYTKVMRLKSELRAQIIQLSERKRRLEDRINQYQTSLGTSDET